MASASASNYGGTDKSYVSLEQHVCEVCGITFDTGSILLDKHIRNTMEHKTVTGYGLCPEHQKLFDDGFVALVECDPKRSGMDRGPAQEGAAIGTLKREKAWRTGRVAHLRRTVFRDLFGPIKDELTMVFVDESVIDRLQSMAQKDEPGSSENQGSGCQPAN